MAHPVLPLSFYVAEKVVVVVGGDHHTDDRISRLEAAGAVIRRLNATSASDPATIELSNAFMLLAHTGDRALDRRLAEHARSSGLLAYAHDQPEVSDFAMPALIRRGPLAIAVSTDGVAPALSRRLRQELERIIDDGGAALDELIVLLSARRQQLPPGQRGELTTIAARLSIEGALRLAE